MYGFFRRGQRPFPYCVWHQFRPQKPEKGILYGYVNKVKPCCRVKCFILPSGQILTVYVFIMDKVVKLPDGNILLMGVIFWKLQLLCYFNVGIYFYLILVIFVLKTFLILMASVQLRFLMTKKGSLQRTVNTLCAIGMQILALHITQFNSRVRWHREGEQGFQTKC